MTPVDVWVYVPWMTRPFAVDAAPDPPISRVPSLMNDPGESSRTVAVFNTGPATTSPPGWLMIDTPTCVASTVTPRRFKRPAPPG